MPQTAAVAVSDTTPVSVLHLYARVVTDVRWDADPASEYAYPADVRAVAHTVTSLTAEGDAGLLYAHVLWSDGLREEVGYAPIGGTRELRVAGGAGQVTLGAPGSDGGDADFWRVGVAVGAETGPVDSVLVNWTVCGLPISSGVLPLNLVLPDAVGVALRFVEPRLAPAGSTATQPGVGVRSSSALVVTVTFRAADGSLTTRDLSADSRVSYSTPGGAGCAAANNAANTASVLAAASCSHVMAVATVSFAATQLVANATVPVVRVASLALDSHGYPAAGNTGVSVPALGLVPCSSDRFTSATARLRLALDDGPSLFDVTPYATFASNASAVVQVSGTRLQGLSAGAALVSGSFGSDAASVVMQVHDAALDPVTALSWKIPGLVGGTTLRGAPSSTTATDVDLSFGSGLVWRNLRSSGAFSGWADLASLVRFNSSRPDAIELQGDEGTLRLLENWYEPVQLTARLACEPGGGPGWQRGLFANLLPVQLDIDLGASAGLQFSAAAVGGTLSFEVRVVPAVGDYLRSVLFKLTAAGGMLDSAPPAVWTAASPVQFAVTAALDLPGEPETLLQVSGANTPDPGSTPRGAVLLGTLTVNVASAGLAAITGVILSMESVASAGCETPAPPAPWPDTIYPVPAHRVYTHPVASRRYLRNTCALVHQV